ncbi:MAG TPA: TadE/TadG family type IV pilus assembly protein [Candidatus Baltobacteraceae bacterium]|nr:TadE/TadG family type IV pilus assembly protein [Candidatus Baltobacteraceae bacterium]
MKRHGERGASLPEAAIVMTLLLTFMFGVVDFGRAFYTYGLVGHLARQGARWAIVRGSQCSGLDHCPAQPGAADIQPYIRSLSEGATDPTQITAQLSFPSCTGASGGANDAPGCVAQVTVTYPFSFLLPFVHSGQITMTSSSQMVISN